MDNYTLTVPAAPPAWRQTDKLLDHDWDILPALPPFRLVDDSAAARWQTTVRICADRERFYVRFDCDDEDIWGTYSQRDQPLYDEEVVELFLAPGTDDPTRYYEFEVSPHGVLFDAHIHNPQTTRAEIDVVTGWDCPGIAWSVTCDEAVDQWTAVLSIPWTAVASAAPPPPVWRANFYRIERPRHLEPEFSCWSPTLTEPADFHQPARFGSLIIAPPDV